MLPENTLDSVCDAIEAVAEVAGRARPVAIGSDFDGGFGAEQTPRARTVADLGGSGSGRRARLERRRRDRHAGRQLDPRPEGVYT